ncbi:uncharacterized protein [Watersipora subatra]|uniref:uncharacterized protein n=1 Tax=Watersipora subatra TaxID=2589382 RepID=UPI00355B2C50
MEGVKKLKTEEVITSYIQYRLSHRVQVTVPGLDCSPLVNGSQDHPVMVALRNLVNSSLRYRAVQELYESYRKKSGTIVNDPDCKRASEYFTRAITSSFFAKHGPLVSPDYSWSRVALSIDITSQLAEDAAVSRKAEKVKMLIDWIRLVFQRWHVDMWVENQGGWEQLLRITKEKLEDENVKLSEEKQEQSGSCYEHENQIKYVKDVLGQTHALLHSDDNDASSLSKDLPQWNLPPQPFQLPESKKNLSTKPLDELLKTSETKPIPWPPGLEYSNLCGDPNYSQGTSYKNYEVSQDVPDYCKTYYDIQEMPKFLEKLRCEKLKKRAAVLAGREVLEPETNEEQREFGQEASNVE